MAEAAEQYMPRIEFEPYSAGFTIFKESLADKIPPIFGEPRSKTFRYKDIYIQGVYAFVLDGMGTVWTAPDGNYLQDISLGISFLDSELDEIHSIWVEYVDMDWISKINEMFNIDFMKEALGQSR